MSDHDDGGMDEMDGFMSDDYDDLEAELMQSGAGAGAGMGDEEGAVSCKLELRLGEYPQEMRMHDASGKLMPSPALEEDSETGMTSLPIPPGCFVRCVPPVNTCTNEHGSGSVSDSHHKYWTITFEVQWTITGKGGGFCLMMPSDDLERTLGTLYVSNLDGSISSSPPSEKAPPPEVKAEEGKEPDPALVEEALQARKAAAEAHSATWRLITVTYTCGQLALLTLTLTLPRTLTLTLTR